MKKLLLSLGAIASVAAPVAAVVACGSTTPGAKDDYKGLVLSAKDLGEDFSMDNAVLAEQVSTLADKLLSSDTAASKDDISKDNLNGVKVLNFKFEGQENSFNFLTDKFLRGGNAAKVEFKDSADIKADELSDKIANPVTGKLSSLDEYKAIEAKLKALSFGEYSYVKQVADVATDADQALAIDPAKGLVINPAWLAEYKTLLATLKTAEAAVPADNAALDKASQAVDAKVHSLEDRIRYVIRVVVASKTNLHEGVVFDEATKWVGFGWVTTNRFEKATVVAPKAAAVSGTTEIVTGLEQTAFDALTDDTFNLISDEAALATALGLTTLPTELSLTGAPSIHFDSATKVLKLTSGLKGETLFTLKVKA